MKIEEAIKQIDCLAEFIMKNIEGEPSKSEGAVECAIRLLEKQIAVRPLGFDDGGSEYYEGWVECPKCSESIPEYTLKNETECYCLGCGQFLNWSEEE